MKKANSQPPHQHRTVKPNPQIPAFHAWPLVSLGDSTVFVNDNHAFNTSHDTEAHEHSGDFNSLQEFFDSQRDATWSHAGEVQLKRESGHVYNARGFLCYTARRQSISATLRSIECPVLPQIVEDDVKPKPDWNPQWLQKEWLKWNYKPSNDRKVDGKHFWFSISDLCWVLSDRIFGRTGNYLQRRNGLLVLSGGTNSSKSQIARGLIHMYLNDRIACKTKGERSPHLVTFEDPIERFYIGPARFDKLELPPPPWPSELSAILNKPSVSENQIQLHEHLNALPKTLLAQWNGLDYTPRELNLDVPDLAQGLGDALRQTPTVFFVGEVRNSRDWIEILDFAGTGHLIITTAHAGCLLEAIVKILSAVRADTPAERRRYASRVLAVVHLRPWPATSAGKGAEKCNLLLPAMWRNTEQGLASLSADGMGAVVAQNPSTYSLSATSCLGRNWFANELLTRVGKDTTERASAWNQTLELSKADLLTSTSAQLVEKHIHALAVNADLKGE